MRALSFFVRRFVLGLAALLLVGGWGATRYADAQLQAASGKKETVAAWTGEKIKASAWVTRNDVIPGKTLYVAGVIGMGVGAALVVIAFPRGAWVPQGG